MASDRPNQPNVLIPFAEISVEQLEQLVAAAQGTQNDPQAQASQSGLPEARFYTIPATLNPNNRTIYLSVNRAPDGSYIPVSSSSSSEPPAGLPPHIRQFISQLATSTLGSESAAQPLNLAATGLVNLPSISSRPIQAAPSSNRSDPRPGPSSSTPARSNQLNQAMANREIELIELSDTEEPEAERIVRQPPNRRPAYRRPYLVIGPQPPNLARVDNQQRNLQLMRAGPYMRIVNERLVLQSDDGGNNVAPSPSVQINANDGQEGGIRDEADPDAPNDDDKDEEEDQVIPNTSSNGEADDESEFESHDNGKDDVPEPAEDDDDDDEADGQVIPNTQSNDEADDESHHESHDDGNDEVPEPTGDDDDEAEGQVIHNTPSNDKSDEESEPEPHDNVNDDVPEPPEDDDDEADSQVQLPPQKKAPIRAISTKTKQKKTVQRASSSSQPERESKNARIIEILNRIRIPTRIEDTNCWSCHESTSWTEKEILRCKRCNLVWHKKCSDFVFQNKTQVLIRKTKQPKYKENLKRKQAWILDLPSVIDSEICIECARKEAGFVFCVLEGVLKDVDLDDSEVMSRIATTFGYVVERLSNHEDKNGNKMFAEFEKIHYFCLVPEQIDFGWLRENVCEYQCTEEFMFYIKMMVHNYIVSETSISTFWVYEKQKPMLDQLLAIVTQELEAIDRCDSCYRNYYEVNTKKVMNEMWMTCENAHSLVWAPNHNFWWPAKVFEFRETNYCYLSEEFVWIQYFGENKEPKRIRVLKPNDLNANLYTYTRAAPHCLIEIYNRKGDKQKWGKLRDKAIEDAKKYHTKYWNRYFAKEYNLRDVSFPFSLNDLFQVVEGVRNYRFDSNFVLEERRKADVNKPSTSRKRKANEQPPSGKKISKGPAKSESPKVKKPSEDACTCRKRKAPMCPVHSNPPNDDNSG